MVSAYQSIVVTHSGQRIGIVSHGDPLRVLYDRIHYPEREIPPYPELVQELSLDTAQSLRMEISAGEIIESEIIPADS
jgi:broad specificity phosphatase PhoE